MYAGFPVKDSIPARACWERCAVLAWALEPTVTFSEIPRPPDPDEVKTEPPAPAPE